MNPFEDDIISEPRNVEKSISGLNDKPLENLLLRFQEIISPPLPRKEKLAHAQLIISPEPGYGKSHLIGRLFHKLKQKATLVYLRPFEDAFTCWKSILQKTVQELNFPDRIKSDGYLDAPTQIQAFAHGILTHMLIQAVKSGTIKSKNKNGTVKILQKTVTDFRKNKKNLEFVRKNHKLLVNYCIKQLTCNNVYLNASPSSWLAVLFRCAYFPMEDELRETCLDWLKGGSIDPDEAKDIGIKRSDVGNPDISLEGLNGSCKERLMDFCKLAGFFRPFVFCFDNTDEYAKDEMLSKALGSVIQTLRDDCCNQMTLLTANRHVWTESIRPYFQDAQRDRLSFPLELEGLNKAQSEELIELRIEGWEKIDSETVKRFYDQEWLNNIFSMQPVFGVREFLKRCDVRWQVLTETFNKSNKYTIAEYYGKAVENVKSQRRRLTFESDTLLWLVREVAGSIPGLSVEKYKSKYLSLVWKYEDREYFFGFEAGSHWKRWKAIVREAELHNIENSNTKFIFFRTPELAKIPGKKWKVAKQITDAKKKCLSIMYLDKEEEIPKLYAGYDLYVDAGEGNIPFNRSDVLKFLEKQLEFFWDRIREPVSYRENNDNHKPEAVTKSLVNEIRELVYSAKFMSVDDLMEKISIPVSKDMIYEAQQYISEIKIYTHPNMTVFKWQSNQ